MGYWPLDENTGTSTANDRSGNEGNGTIGSGSGSDSFDPSWINGKYGSALKFVGEAGSSAGDIISTATNFSYPKNVTTEAWIYLTGDSPNGYEMIVNQGQQNFCSGYWLAVDNIDRLTWNINNDTADDGCEANINYTTTLSDNIWYHVAGTYDGTNTQLYLNGVLVGSTTSASGDIVYKYTENAAIGVMASTLPGSTYFTFLGLIDDVRIYNYARTQAQIIEDMNAGHPVGGSPVGSQVGY